MIKTILFDLDDTLLPEESAEAATLDATCSLAERNSGVCAASLAERFRLVALALWQQGPAYGYCQSIGVGPWEGLWGRFEGNEPRLSVLRDWVENYRTSAWRITLAGFKVFDRELVQRLKAAYVSERGRQHVPYPEVARVVADLSAEHTCLVVTNGAPDVQREKLRMSGLGSLFSGFVVSGDPDVGSGKPDPEIFRIALNRVGCAPSESVMVGDSWERDICGARRFGMHAVWVRRQDRLTADESSSVPVISRIDLIEEALARISRSVTG
jgi:putative hydrolase of the HAD superfamily